MKFIRPLALLVIALLIAPASAHAGHAAYNSYYSNHTYMGSPSQSDNSNAGSAGIASTNTDQQVLVSNTGSWEAIQDRANAVRNGTSANRIITNNNTGTSGTNGFVNTSSTNNNRGYAYNNGYYNNGAYSTNNTGSNRYLNTQSLNNARYNFQYGGYTIQNQINNQRQYASYGRLSGYNFNGDPAYYNGAAYQNYRGYDNFAGGYNLGYYGY